MEKIIEVKDLVKSYKEVKAVKGISFDVDKGSFFAFLGINGAGKSTTINILCTVLQKDSGTVKISGFDLDKEANKIRNEIGIVFQTSVLDDLLTVEENLKARAAYYDISGIELQNRLYELTGTFELTNILKQKYKNLSGGQKRRVDIARALINSPKILFLDEPTTGLDPQTRKMVWDTINKLRAETNLTVFLTTHYMEETTLADKVVIIDEGKIIGCDTPHNLKAEYAHDHIIWYTDKSDEAEEVIKESKFDYKYSKDAYVIKIKNSMEASEFLSKNKEKVNDFEVIKGNMDDVFLNITGHKLGE